MADAPQYDYDWIVVGSGFGGSVSALRLAQKGYRVAILECGRRFADDEFAERVSQVRKSLWMPRLGMKGILRMTLFKDLMVISGSGVGGGSLVYGQTLYRATSHFFEGWERASGVAVDLDEYYTEAERMLGVVDHPRRTAADALMMKVAAEVGAGDSFRPTPIGVYFGQPGVTVDDPYFGGEGPARTGCIECGGCFLGCRYNAKNTLPKNYLWLAEKLGVEIIPERLVTSVEPIGSADGADGYRISSERSGRWMRKDRESLTARGVVFAAGALGTNTLLAQCKNSGALPRLSDRVGEEVRTNSESMTAVTVPDDRGWSRSAVLTSSMFPTEKDHVETWTFGPGGDLYSLLFTLLTPNGTRLTRPLKMLWQILCHPRRFLMTRNPRGWSRRSLAFGMMQAIDGSMQFVAKRGITGRYRLTTKVNPDAPIKSFLPLANEIGERVARHTGGVAQSLIPEVLFGVPGTAHLLGGAVIATDPSRGVIDLQHRVFGYQNMLVCDGAAVPANLGVNPSLTITAMAERAMAAVPAADQTSRDLTASAR